MLVRGDVPAFAFLCAVRWKDEEYLDGCERKEGRSWSMEVLSLLDSPERPLSGRS